MDPKLQSIAELCEELLEGSILDKLRALQAKKRVKSADEKPLSPSEKKKLLKRFPELASKLSPKEIKKGPCGYAYPSGKGQKAAKRVMSRAAKLLRRMRVGLPPDTRVIVNRIVGGCPHSNDVEYIALVLRQMGNNLDKKMKKVSSTSSETYGFGRRQMERHTLAKYELNQLANELDTIVKKHGRKKG